MELSQRDLWVLRSLVQKAGWKGFISNIASLMAEQADKVKRDSKQDVSLYQMSNFLHTPAVLEMFADCGNFDYRAFAEWVPEEFKQMILDNPPPAQS